MVQETRPSFELSLGEVSLKAPETPLYLTLAVQVLDARRQELEGGTPGAYTPPTPVSPTAAAATSPAMASVAVETPPAQVAVAEPAVALTVEVSTSSQAEAVDDVETPVLETEPVATSGGTSLAVVDVVETEAPGAVEEALQTPEAPRVTAPTLEPASAAPEAPARRARWFRGQFPRVTFEDGSSRVLESLDALKELLQSRGLQPHPRGDASMLLWQVRNRLGLSVDQVDR